MKSWNLFEVLILYLKIPLYSTNTTNQPHSSCIQPEGTYSVFSLLYLTGDSHCFYSTFCL
jgi:hypothetical protein